MTIIESSYLLNANTILIQFTIFTHCHLYKILNNSFKYMTIIKSSYLLDKKATFNTVYHFHLLSSLQNNK